MQELTWHPHYDVWALIITLVIFFEFTTKKEHIKKPKRKTWYSGLVVLWIFTDYPIHDIGEKYLFSVHSVEHLVLALVSPPLLLMGMHRDMKELISIKNFSYGLFLQPFPQELLRLPFIQSLKKNLGHH